VKPLGWRRAYGDWIWREGSKRDPGPWSSRRLLRGCMGSRAVEARRSRAEIEAEVLGYVQPLSQTEIEEVHYDDRPKWSRGLLEAADLPLTYRLEISP